MATIPALPPGFELEDDIPPPPGFVLEGAPKADFSGTVGGSRSTAPDQPTGLRRDLGMSARSVLQGAGGLLGAVGGDAFNYYLVPGDQPSYRDAASGIADRLGLPAPRTARERVMGDVGEALTGVATGFGAAGALRSAASPLASAVGQQMLANPGMQVASAAAGSGAAGVTREAGGSPTAQMVAGLAGGVGPAAIRTGSPSVASGMLAGTVPETRREIARQASARGIDLTPAQLSDSRFVRYAQSALKSVPFTGAAKRSEEQVKQFNRAVARAIGEQADTVDTQVYARAKERQSQLFNELTERNAIKVDDSLLRGLGNISENAGVSPAAKQAVDAAIDRLYSQSTTGPGGVVIPGRAYQSLDSDLGQVARAGGPEAYYVGQVRDALRRAMDRSVSKDDAQAWAQLRREYGNRKTIAPLVAKSGDEGISPQQVLGAATNTASAKEAAAAGRRGEMATLGNIGRLMREPPSSGTAERAAIGGLFATGGLMNPAVASASYLAAQLAARGLDSRTIARLMVRENPGLSMRDAELIAAQATIPATAATATGE